MKKIIILLLAVFATVAMATSAFDIKWGDQSTYSNLPGNTLRMWAEGIEGRIGYNIGTGKIFYVDSGVVNEGDGSSWNNALATLDEAINKCTGNRGDVIYVAQGHAETLSADGDCDLDCAGITVIGCGSGSLRPTFTFDSDDDDGVFCIAAANVAISNLIFEAGEADVNEAVDIASAGDNYKIINCEFNSDTPGTNEFTSCIRIGDTANDGLIKGCRFKMGAGDAEQAIYIDADIVGLTIEDNVIWGDYSTACILGDEASDDIIIRGNILFNGTMGGDGELNSEPAIEVADSTSGFVLDNRIVSDVATGLLMRVADDMVFMNNYISDTDGDEFSGTKEDDAASITAHADG